MQYKLDNEFELVFVVAYQNIIKLAYIDKFLNEIQLRFRDKYKQIIQNSQFSHDFSDFQNDFDSILSECETESKLAAQAAQKPKSYKESDKSKRTVSSMMETKKGMFSNFMSLSEPSKPAQVKSNTSGNKIK